MDLANEQWAALDPLIGEMPRRADGQGRLKTQDGQPLRRFRQRWKV